MTTGRMQKEQRGQDSALSRLPQRLAWHGFIFDLPAEWEVIAYSNNALQGQLDLRTRRGLQAQISWRTCKQSPDIPRILLEVHRRDLQAREPDRAEKLNRLENDTVGSFITAHGLPGELFQAGLYLQEEELLLQLAFPGYTPETCQTVWQPILQSFRPNIGDPREWSIFGLSARLPRTFRLAEISPLPANVSLMFENARHLQITLHRWGMPETLLQGRSLDRYYTSVLRAAQCLILQTERSTFRQMEAATVTYKRRGQFGMEKLVGRWWTGQAVIWQNRQENRLYAFEQLGPQRLPRLEIDHVLVHE